VSNDLGAFVAAEVARAESIFDSYRDRALRVIGVAGGLVTLVTALLAVAAGDRDDILPSQGRFFLVASMVLLVGATVLGLLIHSPRRVEAADPAELPRLIRDHWDDEDWDQSVAKMQTKYLADLRTVNETFATLFSWALRLELGGIAALGVLAVLIFEHLT
jgi:hypothetical protein